MRAPRTRWFFLLPLLLAACDDATGPSRRIVAGVDLDALFAPPTAQELDAVRQDWQARDLSVQGYREERTDAVSLAGHAGTLRVVSHTLGGARHYGAVVIPDGAAPRSLPVLIYAHGGDDGFSVDDLLFLAAVMDTLADDFVFVAPSFRSEPLRVGPTLLISGGEPSPWDGDVDDALALLNAVLEHTPAADPARVGVAGFSRGGGVALLLAIRDPRIDVVVEFFGPTDFFDVYVQEIVEEALKGSLRDLPGLETLNERFLQPLQQGRLSTADVRLELVRRSAVLFASSLPQVQVHHGTADTVVAVSQAERLADALRAIGRGEPAFQLFLYPGGGHDPLTLPGSVPRAIDFLARLLAPAGSAAPPAPTLRRSTRPWSDRRLVRRGAAIG